MQIEILIRAEVERESGPFASRDDLEQAIIENLDDPGTLEPGDNVYNVVVWDVEPQEMGKRPAKKPTADVTTVLRSMRQTIEAASVGLNEGDLALVRVNLDRILRKWDALWLEEIKSGKVKP